jgi:N6-L-threonylcarbamoyladenine synthase
MKTELNVLGIETSCDETSAAIVVNGNAILANVIASQADLHARYGGVVPEVASRKHVERMLPTIMDALSSACMTYSDIDAIAVTNRPGLLGALLVGVSAAKSLAFLLKIPAVTVHHLEGHIYSGFLAAPNLAQSFPLLILIVSGGHTQIVRMNGHGRYTILGKTRDDAAGEAPWAALSWRSKYSKGGGIGRSITNTISAIQSGQWPGLQLQRRKDILAHICTERRRVDSS